MRTWLRRAGIGLGVLVGLVALLGGTAFAISERNLRLTYDVPRRERAVPSDLGAIIAWARQLPPVDRELPPTQVGPVARLMNAFGKLPLAAQVVAERSSQYAAGEVTAPNAGPTAEYGKYLADVGGCTGCHGPGLSGGHVPGTPPDFKPAANITPAGIGHYTEADFFRALREGVRPPGTGIDPFMPWKLAREMSDEEIHAVYAYVRTVPPRKFGNR